VPSGATVINQEFRADPIALGQIANLILDILPTYVHSSAEYSYLAADHTRERCGSPPKLPPMVDVPYPFCMCPS
jgi:hypothetical protein